MNNRQRKKLSVLLLGAHKKNYLKYFISNNDKYLKRWGMVLAPEYYIADNPKEYGHIVGFMGLLILRIKVWIRRLLKK